MITSFSYSINIEDFNMENNQKEAVLALIAQENQEAAKSKAEKVLVQLVPATEEVAAAEQDALEVVLAGPYADDAM